MYSKVKFANKAATKQFLYTENKDWLEIYYCTTIIFLEHNKSNLKIYFLRISFTKLPIFAAIMHSVPIYFAFITIIWNNV